MTSIFRFKQFEVDQQACPMKINTDGVLLAALANIESPHRILDIGTGTGVMALMLAQRFPQATVDAIDIYEPAFTCAAYNFKASSFVDRLKAFHTSVEDFEPADPYDLIVSNPPFFMNALTNPDIGKRQARHTDILFFEALLNRVGRWLTNAGLFFIIWPPDIFQSLIPSSLPAHLKHVAQIHLHSFEETPGFRVISTFARRKEGDAIQEQTVTQKRFVIYQSRGQYSAEYRRILKPFFLNF